MGYEAPLLAAPIFWLGGTVALVLVVFAAKTVNWAHFGVELSLQHRFYFSAVVLVAAWCLRAEFVPGVYLHLLGMTVVTLLFGYPLALIIGAVALGASSFLSGDSWAVIGVNYIAVVALPAALTALLVRWEAQRFKLFFAYIFVCGFFGGALSAMSAALFVMGLGFVTEGTPFSSLENGPFIYLPLVMLPEGFINGMITASLMIFAPRSLLTLDDSRYP